MIETLKQVGIIPVVKINHAKTALGLAKALSRGGLSAAEITFRTDAAEESIRLICQEVPEIFVCAGTVLNVENAEKAVKAGAKAIISPGINLEVVRWCKNHAVPVIPGCATPTEVEVCMREGLKLVKLFPAEAVGGIKMLKSLAGPYKSIMFMPTGGINLKNAQEYLKLKNVVACGGSWIVPEYLLDEERFDKIEKLAYQAAMLVQRKTEQL